MPSKFDAELFQQAQAQASRQITCLIQELDQLRAAYAKSGRQLTLHQTPVNDKVYDVEDLRKRGLLSADDVARQKAHLFVDTTTGRVATMQNIFRFFRDQFHIGRSTHKRPALKMEAIRENYAGVFYVKCPAPSSAVNSDTKAGTDTGTIAEAVSGGEGTQSVSRPMVFFTPDGVALLVKRWAQAQSEFKTASALV